MSPIKYLSFLVFCTALMIPTGTKAQQSKQRILLNDNWKFIKDDPSDAHNLIYEKRPDITNDNDNIIADARPTEAIATGSSDSVLKRWVLPTANSFIKNVADQHIRPEGNPGKNVSYVQQKFNDTEWQTINLPHDWAIEGPFYKEEHATVGGGMGRLPIQGVGWYRKKIKIPESDKGKQIYLDIDGAMSYAIVWINGNLAGGWPYGYNGFRIDLTPYIITGADNQIAIRIDNPNHSARWYSGAGIYRNVWLVKTNPIHVAQWGTTIQTRNISKESATIDLSVVIENNSTIDKKVLTKTDLFFLNSEMQKSGNRVASFSTIPIIAKVGKKSITNGRTIIQNPKLWGVPPSQKPNLYLAVTQVISDGKVIDEYETKFGIRSLNFDPEKGLFVNGFPVRIQGVNQHHDLGALGAAFNVTAAKRQLDLLKELGCNAIRMAHNPPAPELLDLTDQMGFLVVDEIFDSWERKKTPHDFHLIFKDWHEADTRAFVRRDKNHPSIIAWSFGNEVGEQYTADSGAAIAKRLHDIIREEDSTRPTTASMNFAKPDMPFPKMMDLISLNYQGEGIRDAPAYSHLKGIRTSPLYPAFHKTFPNKMIVSSETASALSTRGSYIFPVTSENSAPVSDSTGGDPIKKQVSAYELYTAQFGASPDKVFASQDKFPFVAGEFVWTGWDYIGEPTPYYTARSSYSGIIDLAGFKKDRFYLYQSRWRPNLPMAHILPHWNWPNRLGETTPIHVFTSGDEAEIFLNGSSLGRKKKAPYEYRLRWDDIKYEPGTVKVVAYKKGKFWATDSIQTTGTPAKLQLATNSKTIAANGTDLAFITVSILDKEGHIVPHASNLIQFEIEGAGEIIATDNGDPADLESFKSHKRNAFYGLALVIVKPQARQKGSIKIKAVGEGLQPATLSLQCR